jgi:hypothetical protein
MLAAVSSNMEQEPIAAALKAWVQKLRCEIAPELVPRVLTWADRFFSLDVRVVIVVKGDDSIVNSGGCFDAGVDDVLPLTLRSTIVQSPEV